MATKEEIAITFDSIYFNRLVPLEEKFHKQLNDYALGDKIKVSDIDKTYKDIKGVLKEVRKLAIEAKSIGDEE